MSRINNYITQYHLLPTILKPLKFLECLGYESAVLKDEDMSVLWRCGIDQPRNLAKNITVK